MHPVIIEGCEVFTDGAIELLQQSEPYIASLGFEVIGDNALNGIALDIIPWHVYFEMSLRFSSDTESGERNYNSADWQHFQFTRDASGPASMAAEEFLVKHYENSKYTGHESSMLLYMAAAKALLSPKLNSCLRELFDSPEVGNNLFSGPFEYIVSDPDECLPCNYCDVMFAHSVADRLARQLTIVR